MRITRNRRVFIILWTNENVIPMLCVCLHKTMMDKMTKVWNEKHFFFWRVKKATYISQPSVHTNWCSFYITTLLSSCQQMNCVDFFPLCSSCTRRALSRSFSITHIFGFCLSFGWHYKPLCSCQTFRCVIQNCV